MPLSNEGSEKDDDDDWLDGAAAVAVVAVAAAAETIKPSDGRKWDRPTEQRTSM